MAVLSFDRFQARCAAAPVPEDRPAAWEAERPWYLLYTSGTTGRPKAVIQTAGMALANAVNIQQATGLGASDVTLNFLPLFHTAGINLHALPLFIAGGRSLVIPKFDADTVMTLLAGRRISLFFGVPAVFQALSLHPSFATADVTAVRHWGCGGAPIAEPLLRAFLARGATICNGMGMTETGPTVFLMDPAEAAAKIGSVGRPQILAEVRIVDVADRDVAPGEAGELLFRGPGVTPGYWNNPEATARAFAPGGWLRSAISAAWMRMDAISSSTGSRTCSFPAARTSIPPRSRPRFTPIRPCWRWRCSASPIGAGARRDTPSSCSGRGRTPIRTVCGSMPARD